MDFNTCSSLQTISLGKKIGQFLQPNDIIALFGDLGAGKTTLAKGIAQGLGIKSLVTSPTFILINEYPGKLRLYHIDLYRLENMPEIESLGLQDVLYAGGVCVIEWAERLAKLLPRNAHRIKFKIKSENEREICVSSALAARLKK